MYVKMKHKTKQTARNNIHINKTLPAALNTTHKILFIWLFFMYVRMVFIII